MTENFQYFFENIKNEAVFKNDGPRPHFLLDTPKFKVLVVGLDPGSKIPVHPGESAMYHFLEGEGTMTVAGETFDIKAGQTVIVPGGERRGINARTRLIFLGSKGEE